MSLFDDFVSGVRGDDKKAESQEKPESSEKPEAKGKFEYSKEFSEHVKGEKQ
ncbi:MAG: hypothetical protein FWF38_00490 [Spirochaetaceae bacterium]|nr:hypothetical protein [Spirochaetaceae bacterium]